MSNNNNQIAPLQLGAIVPANLKGPLILVLAAVCIGLAPIGLRFSTMEPTITAVWRFVFAVPVLVVTALIFKQPIGRPNKALIAAGVFFSLDMCFWHLALVRTSVANATFFVNLGSVAVGLAAWLVLKQRPSISWPVAALFATAGAAAMAFGASEDSASDLTGDSLALIAAACITGYLLFATIARSSVSGFQAIFWITISAIPVGLIFALILGEEIFPHHYSDFAAPLFLAFFAQALGQGLLVYGVGLTTPSIGGVILLIQPVIAGLIAWPLFGEELALIQMAGAALILFGVWLAGRGK